MSLWQVFRGVLPAHVAGNAYVDMTNHNDFVDLPLRTQAGYYPTNTLIYPLTVEGWWYQTDEVDYPIEHTLIGKWLYTSPQVGWRMLGNAFYQVGGVDYASLTLAVLYKQLTGYYIRVNIDVPRAILFGWHHLAFTLYPHIIGGTPQVDTTVYIDGTSYPGTRSYQFVYNLTGITDTSVNMYIGGHLPLSDDPYSKLMVGWVRISRLVRYSTNFTPIARGSPPANDGDTIGLWYFNEGTGPTIYDQTGGTGKDATSYGGVWSTGALTLNI